MCRFPAHALAPHRNTVGHSPARDKLSFRIEERLIRPHTCESAHQARASETANETHLVWRVGSALHSPVVLNLKGAMPPLLNGTITVELQPPTGNVRTAGLHSLGRNEVAVFRI